jgi:hypothetical protein
MVTHIATAATQQSSATEDINNSMNQTARLLIESGRRSAAVGESVSGTLQSGFRFEKAGGKFQTTWRWSAGCNQQQPGCEHPPLRSFKSEFCGRAEVFRCRSPVIGIPRLFRLHFDDNRVPADH